MRCSWLFFAKVVIILFITQGHAQSTYRKIAGDTIVVTQNEFGINVFLLDGKKLNIPVMKWFMSEYPVADSNIRWASLGNTLSKTSYGISGLFIFSGFLVDKRNKPARKDLFTLGGVIGGSGVVIQIVSEFFKIGAVQAYNDEILLFYLNDNPVTWKMGAHSGFVWRF